MYVIVVTAYDKAFTVVSQRVWKGRIFDSYDEAKRLADTVLIDGDVSLVVKGLR